VVEKPVPLKPVNPKYASILGCWKIVRGKDSKKGAYVGEVKILLGAGERLCVFGYYDYKSIFRRSWRFRADGTFANNRLKFRYTYWENPGFIGWLGNLFGANNKPKLRTVNGDYTLSPNGLCVSGSWKVLEKPERYGNGTWVKKELKIVGVEPSEVPRGERCRKVTVIGENLPGPESVRPGEIAFRRIWGTDRTVRCVRVYEVSDDGTRLTIGVAVDEKAKLGDRDVRIFDKRGKDLLRVVDTLRMKLGRTEVIEAGEYWGLYVPNRTGGWLRLESSKGTPELYRRRGGSPIALSDGWAKIESSRHGMYYVKVRGAEGQVRVRNRYVTYAETPADKKPWNFWYFPFVDKSTPGMNLYDRGGAYEKLDRALGLAPNQSSGFSRLKHMDFPKFKGPAAGERNLYVSNTTKGYAYCYQRSTDPDKSWWGHCWGSVVASSLYREPAPVTVGGVDGRSYSFSQEELEGLLSSYFTNHSIYPTNYMRGCPAGPPSPKRREWVDRYCDDFFAGLEDGIGKKGLPLASNLRAELNSSKPADKNQVWNHVIWRYEAEFKEVAEKAEKTWVELDLVVYATNDIFPSGEDAGPRKERFVFRLKYDRDGTIDRDAMRYQNWMSASHYCPAYLWRIERSTRPSGTENAVLRGRLPALEKLFGYKRIK
jgi:hypothetical protein